MWQRISDDTDTTNTAASAVTGGDFRLLNGPFTPSTLNGFNGVVSFSATGKPIKTMSNTMSNFDPVTLTGSGDETFA